MPETEKTDLEKLQQIIISENDKNDPLNVLVKNKNDDDFDDDDFEEIEEVKVKPEKQKSKPTKRPPVRRQPRESITRRHRTAESDYKDRIDEAYDDILGSLEFGNDDHKISVYRLEPSTDEDGNNISGLLNTFHSAITTEDIQKKYGGGTYKVTIMGPKASTGRGNEIKASKQLKISGPPKIKKKEDEGSAIIDRVLKSQEELAMRAQEEAKKSQELLLKMLMDKKSAISEIAPIIDLLKDKDDKEDKMLPIITMMQQQAEQQRIQMMAQLELQREQAKQEREDRRREQEAAEKRHEREMQIQMQKHEQMMAQLKAEAERAERDARESRERFERQMEAANNQKNDMMLQIMQIQQKSEMLNAQRDKESQSALFAMMQQGSKQAMEMAMQAASTQVAVLSESLRDAREQKTENDFEKTMGNLTALMTLQNNLLGKNEPEKPTWEKVMDKIGDIGPGLAEAAGNVISRRSGNNSNSNDDEIQPGTVIVADVDDDVVVEEVSVSSSDNNSTNKDGSNDTVENKIVKTETDSLDYVEISDSDEIYDSMSKFIKNMDLAVQKDEDPEKFFNDVVSKCPKGLLKLISESSEKDMIDVIESNVPSDWKITSPKGNEFVLKIRSMICDHVSKEEKSTTED